MAKKAGVEDIQVSLNQLVEQEKLTEAAAHEILEWIDRAPEAVPSLGRWILLEEGELKPRLHRRVEGGSMDRDDADALAEWIRARPAGTQALREVK